MSKINLNFRHTKKYLHIIALLFVFRYVTSNQLCFGQIQPMGFTRPVVTPPSDKFFISYKPKLKLLGDTLYVCSNTGIYKKNLKDNADWELYAFENIPIIEFVKNGNKLLAISTGTRDGKDSLLLLSNDNGQTYINYTHPHFLEYGFNYLSRISQNPENSNSLLVLHVNSGISKSDDFGTNWKNLNDINFGNQNWHLGFHPLDTTTLFYSGETGFFSGMLCKSSDNGSTWSNYMHPGGDNCIHSITFHPTNPDILVYSGEGTMGKSTDKGETWNITNLYSTGMYFYKVLFDEENPTILYSTGINGKYTSQDSIWVYRSTDTGSSWELAYNEKMNENCGGVFDMAKYKNKLIFYTRNCGLFELDLGTISNIHNFTTRNQPLLTIFPNPTQGILQFETDIVINNIEIIELTGSVLQKTNISNNERQIDISRLNSGIYFVVFHTKELKITKKIVIK